MPGESKVRLVKELLEAWGSRDTARYAALLDKECLIESHTRPPQVRGRESAIAAMKKFFLTLRDLRFTLKEGVATGNLVIASWSAHATTRRANRQITVGGCTVAEVKQSKLLNVWHYWDNDQILRGVLPRPGRDAAPMGSSEERAGGPGDALKLLFVVSRSDPERYRYLRQIFPEEESVKVVLDRRARDRREREVATALDRRRADRRLRPIARDLTRLGLAIVRL
jgi:ketosteroid isomerase-like protein